VAGRGDAETLGVPTDEDDLGSPLGELSGDGGTQPATGPDDRHHRTIKFAFLGSRHGPSVPGGTGDRAPGATTPASSDYS
jgi:hypothetical protein